MACDGRSSVQRRFSDEDSDVGATRSHAPLPRWRAFAVRLATLKTPGSRLLSSNTLAVYLYSKRSSRPLSVYLRTPAGTQNLGNYRAYLSPAGARRSAPAHSLAGLYRRDNYLLRPSRSLSYTRIFNHCGTIPSVVYCAVIFPLGRSLIANYRSMHRLILARARTRGGQSYDGWAERYCVTRDK